MNNEKFLSFWSQHNTTIIEILLALVILTTLILAFRSFFSSGKKSQGESTGDLGLSTELEEKLEMILETQKQQSELVAKVAAVAPKALSQLDDSEGDVDDFEIQEGVNKKPIPVPVVDEEAQQIIRKTESKVKESEAEIAQLRITLSETQQKMLEMKKELEVAKNAPAPVAAPAADSSGLEEKVAELEARLADYDIISQEIADITNYKEENARLKEQLEQLLQQSMLGEAPQATPVKTTEAETETEELESEEDYAAKATEGVVDAAELEKFDAEAHANSLENQIDAALAMAELENAAEEFAKTAEADATAESTESENSDLLGGEFLVSDEMMDQLQNAYLEKNTEDTEKTSSKAGGSEDFPQDLLSEEDAELFSKFNSSVKKS